MRVILLALVVLTACARVDYVTIDSAHDARVHAAEHEYTLSIQQAQQVRERFRQDILRRWRELRVVIKDGEVEKPLVTSQVHAAVARCQNPVPCEQRVTEELNARYSLASPEYRSRARRALRELSSEARLEAYERILAQGQNAAAKASLDLQWAKVKQQYLLVKQRAWDRYTAEVDQSLAVREQDILVERRRIERENEAAAVAMGLTAAAVVGAAAEDRDEGYYTPPRESACLRLDRHALQGCCSWNGGIDYEMTRVAGVVMCHNGKPSPSCPCF